jgi:multidrug resistance efflux pump
MLPWTVAVRAEKDQTGSLKVSPVASPAIPILGVLLFFAAIIAFAIWAMKKQTEVTKQAIATGNPAIVAATEAPMILGALGNILNRPSM